MKIFHLISIANALVSIRYNEILRPLHKCTETGYFLSECLNPFKLSTNITNANNDLKLRRKLQNLSVNDFEQFDLLGRGFIGSVRLVKYKPTGRYYALKRMSKAKILYEKQLKNSRNEKGILEKIDHPFIVKYIGSFQDDYYLYLVTEYLPGGELWDIMVEAQILEKRDAQFYIGEIILAVEYLHSINIVHRDLKTTNVLLDKDGHVRLVDFGFAKVVKTRTRSFCGTNEYLAPEIIQRKWYTKSVDWWSVGSILYDMLTGNYPFTHDDEDKLYEMIKEGVLEFPDDFDPIAEDLIRKLLTVDGNKRIGAEEIKKHPWFSDFDWGKLQRMEYETPFKPTLQFEGDTSHYVVEEKAEKIDPNDPDPYDELFKDF